MVGISHSFSARNLSAVSPWKFIHVLRPGAVNTFVTVLRLGCLVCLAAAALFAGPASKLYQEGRKAERAGEVASAYLLYSQAAALEPRNSRYWLRSQAVRTRAALQASLTPKPAPAEPPPDTPAP